MTLSRLDDPLVGLVAKGIATSLKKSFGYETVGDLLGHFPRRYVRRGELTALDVLPRGEDVTIVAEVLRVTERTMKQRRGSIVEVLISDGTGILSVTFFNQPWRAKELRPGVRGMFAGKVTEYRSVIQLAHPHYELFDSEEVLDADPDRAMAWALTPIPIYPATATLPSWQLQKIISSVLESVGEVPDPIPAGVRRERGLLTFGHALHAVHEPEKDKDWLQARDTLRFQEALLLQVALLQRRQASRRVRAVPRIPTPGGFQDQLDAVLPFTLTAEQGMVGWEIERDLAEDAPMNRLVQGEVGSGKTVVAMRAMMAVADSGGQSALLAPTEVLAGQHLRSVTRTLGPDLAAAMMPTLLTGSLTAAQRRKALLRIVSGQARIVIGTHALISESVEFFDLGLVVIDEQHRFGVEQRDTLRRKALNPPHVLVLTATPIPRTIAMTVFGDLDVSTIHELPVGRAGISSFVVPLAEKPAWSVRVWERMAEELAEGRQAFVVCPAIDPKSGEEGEELMGEGEEPVGKTVASPNARGVDQDAPPRPPIATVEEVFAQLKGNPALTSARIERLHGRMPAEEKDRVMQAFAAGDIDVIVATTVIEVGVDVPNASTMVVLDADRFGVSQLHQLRGRVGRGSVPGLCLLVTSAALDTPARDRIEAVASTLDGFELAEVDLEQRREGDVLGNTQSGARSSLKLLRVTRDGDLITQARQIAAELLADDPDLIRQPELRDTLARQLDDTVRANLAKS